MKFHNSVDHVYGARMIHPATHPLLARLRRSRRFIVLMLLVFVLRIGADVACTAHDILDATLDSAAKALFRLVDKLFPSCWERGAFGQP